MSTRRFILTNILVWLPMLVLDRLSRHIAIAISPELSANYRESAPSLLFANTWNPTMLGGYLPSEYVMRVMPVGAVVLVVFLVCVSYSLKAPVTSLWPLIPITFSVVSNLSDRFIWGMVSDPFVLVFSLDHALAINLADVGCAVGGYLMGLTLAIHIYRRMFSTQYSLEAAHG